MYVKDAEHQPIVFEFNQEKCIEAILYLMSLLAKFGEPVNIERILMLLYFVDKTSLERYGRFIYGENYFAMLTRVDAFHASREINMPGNTEVFEKISKTSVRARRQANIDVLSESDVKCIHQIVSAFGNYPVWQLKQWNQDEAWQRVRAESGMDFFLQRIPIEYIVDMLEDSYELLNYLRNPHV